MIYQNILLATDLGPQSVYILKKAVTLRKLTDANLSVLHVLEPPVTYTAHFAEREQMLEKSKKAAEASLAALCALSNDNKLSYQLVVGAVQQMILETVDNLQSDLVIMGSHGVGGYFHALGSTVRSLMPALSSDLLVVQVKALEKIIAQHPPQPGHFLWQPYVDLSKSQTAERQSPKLSGSQKGFGDVVKKGPRKSMRPPGSPYHGGTRGEDEDNA